MRGRSLGSPDTLRLPCPPDMSHPSEDAIMNIFSRMMPARELPATTEETRH